MWLTGFDAPSCSTLYLDKPMRGHTLMQTIARANRVYGEKVNGLIVDYANVFQELEKAWRSTHAHGWSRLWGIGGGGRFRRRAGQARVGRAGPVRRRVKSARRAATPYRFEALRRISPSLLWD